MKTITVNIINPEANKLLKSLVNLKLITIQNSENGFSKLLKKLRKENSNKPSFEDITKEVEIVRAARYVKKSN